LREKLEMPASEVKN